MIIYAVSDLSGLLDDSGIYLFTDETKAKAKFDSLCSEVEELIDEDLINGADSNDLNYEKTDTSFWVRGEITCDGVSCLIGIAKHEVD